VDPLLVRDGRWLAETLLAETPPQGWPPARGGTLTRDAVYEALAARPLDLPADRLDPLGLLEWTLDEVRLARLDRLGEETRQGLLAWLGGRTGTTGCCTLAAVQTGNGADAVPLALVAGLLADDQLHAVDQVRTAEARGRLAPRYGGHVPSGLTARAWADAARTLVERRMATGLGCL
jgi:hypothetical protein